MVHEARPHPHAKPVSIRPLAGAPMEGSSAFLMHSIVLATRLYHVAAILPEWAEGRPPAYTSPHREWPRPSVKPRPWRESMTVTVFTRLASPTKTPIRLRDPNAPGETTTSWPTDNRRGHAKRGEQMIDDTQLDPELKVWPPAAAIRKNPWDFYAKVRARSTVYRYPDPHPGSGRAVFLATGWNAVKRILTGDDFDSNIAEAMPEMAVHATRPYPDVPSRYGPSSVTFTAGEEHVVKRSWAEMLFEKERLATFEPIIRRVTDRLIDGFIADGTVNITDRLAEALPLEVLTIIMGLPAEDAGRLRHWTESILSVGLNPISSERDFEGATRALREVSEYALQQCLLRVAEPRDDYLSEVIQAQIARDGEFDQNAMVLHVRTMYLVAFHTTAAVIAAGIARLATMPEAQAQLRVDPHRIRRFVEETVRLDAPLQWQARVALTDAEVDGTDVPAGSIVFVAFAAANADPAKFAEPREFHADRRDIAHHLGFGAGEHRCAGAPLARLYAQAAFERLLDRTRNLRLDESASDLEPLPGFNFRIPTRVQVTFDKA